MKKGRGDAGTRGGGDAATETLNERSRKGFASHLRAASLGQQHSRRAHQIGG